MAQKTTLTVYGIPGPVQSFVAKTVADTASGLYKMVAAQVLVDGSVLAQVLVDGAIAADSLIDGAVKAQAELT